jgi:hypothetical protein
MIRFAEYCKRKFVSLASWIHGFFRTEREDYEDRTINPDDMDRINNKDHIPQKNS